MRIPKTAEMPERHPPSAILSLPDEERDDPRVAGEIENVLNRVLGGDYGRNAVMGKT